MCSWPGVNTSANKKLTENQIERRERNKTMCSLRCHRWFSAIALSVVLVSFSQAQTTTATLSGTVEDQNGAVVPGAAVTVVNVATGFQRKTVTNESGTFSVPLLPPTTYAVRVQRDGFAPVEIKNVTLNVGDQKSLQIQLKAGDVNATVQV